MRGCLFAPHFGIMSIQHKWRRCWVWTLSARCAWSEWITQESARLQIAIVVIAILKKCWSVKKELTDSNMNAFQTFHQGNGWIWNNDTLRHANPPFATWSKDGCYPESINSCSKGLNMQNLITSRTPGRTQKWPPLCSVWVFLWDWC